MRKLSEVICDVYLEWHFKTEFELMSDLSNIDERYSNYDGQVDFCVLLAKAILKKIKEKPKTYYVKKESLKELENVFFDVLELELCNNDKNSAYILKDTIKDENNLRFKRIHIRINLNTEKSYKDILSCLLHEMTHAWEDYNRWIKKSKMSLQDEVNKPYYKRYLTRDAKKDFNVYVDLIYTLFDIERNAFTSELVASLEDEKVNDYKDALRLFKKSDTWRNYVELKSYIEKADDEDKELMCKAWNYVYNDNASLSKSYKKIQHLINKTYNKITSLASKIYYEYFSKKEIEEGTIYRQNREFILLLEVRQEAKEMDVSWLSEFYF